MRIYIGKGRTGRVRLKATAKGRTQELILPQGSVQLENIQRLASLVHEFVPGATNITLEIGEEI